MNINLTILTSFIIVAIAIFAASVIHYRDPYEFLKKLIHREMKIL